SDNKHSNGRSGRWVAPRLIRSARPAASALPSPVIVIVGPPRSNAPSGLTCQKSSPGIPTAYAVRYRHRRRRRTMRTAWKTREKHPSCHVFSLLFSTTPGKAKQGKAMPHASVAHEDRAEQNTSDGRGRDGLDRRVRLETTMPEAHREVVVGPRNLLSGDMRLVHFPTSLS
ncbi:hypothetical protein CSHISOI_00390, partial [Colletotrichum shisoi]